MEGRLSQNGVFVQLFFWQTKEMGANKKNISLLDLATIISFSMTALALSRRPGKARRCSLHMRQQQLWKANTAHHPRHASASNLCSPKLFFSTSGTGESTHQAPFPLSGGRFCSLSSSSEEPRGTAGRQAAHLAVKGAFLPTVLEPGPPSCTTGANAEPSTSSPPLSPLPWLSLSAAYESHSPWLQGKRKCKKRDSS